MIQIHDVEQGSPEWFAARLGIPTASEFSSVLAKGEGRTRRTYMLKLAGEVLTGQPCEAYQNGHMERGHLMEDEARALYAFHADADIQRVGFVSNGRKGASPDGLIGANGAVEIKSKAPHLLVELILKGSFPPEHKAQCQGTLWVTEREWIELAAFWPGMPLFRSRAYRDEAYITSLAEAVDAFNAELDSMVESVRRYGSAP